MATRAAAAAGDERILSDGAYHEAMQRAGHLLATRPRTEHEIRARLRGAGFDGDVVERTVERLIELRLIDDSAFALQWVEERARLKGRAPEALVAELAAKGIDRDLAEAALAAAEVDEEVQAKAMAARLVGRVAHKPLPEQGLALMSMLVRRGYSEEAAEAGARSALPPEGWD
jgi:regulatory protein